MIEKERERLVFGSSETLLLCRDNLRLRLMMPRQMDKGGERETKREIYKYIEKETATINPHHFFKLSSKFFDDLR